MRDGDDRIPSSRLPSLNRSDSHSRMRPTKLMGLDGAAPSAAASGGGASTKTLAAWCCLILAAASLLADFDDERPSPSPSSPRASLPPVRRLDGSAPKEGGGRGRRGRGRGRARGPRVLALGGSVTWGACLSDPKRSFPHLLGELLSSDVADDNDGGSAPASAVVHNLAIRGAGAAFPSMCLRSMIEDGASPRGDVHRLPPSPSGDDVIGEGEDDYDVVLLEFSLNGHRGLPLLVRRIRRRYPSAIIVYIELRSLSRSTPTEPRRALRRRDAVERVGGLVWEWTRLPDGFPNHDAKDGIPGDVRELYCEDLHHLSEGGHEEVARGAAEVILPLLRRSGTAAAASASANDKKRGTWGLGDKCHLWHHTGTIPSDLTVSGGGQMVQFDPQKSKFAYEIPAGRSATFAFEAPPAPPLQGGADEEALGSFLVPSTKEGGGGGGGGGGAGADMSMPVYLAHMTKRGGGGEEGPHYYPAVDVVAAASSSAAATTTTTWTRIGPSPASSGGSDGDGEAGSDGDGGAAAAVGALATAEGAAHVVDVTAVGSAAPGRRVSVSLTPSSSSSAGTSPSSPAAARQPFRVVGLSICGACVEMGYGEYVSRMSGCAARLQC